MLSGISMASSKDIGHKNKLATSQATRPHADLDGFSCWKLNIEHTYIAGALASFQKEKHSSMIYCSYQENASTKFPTCTKIDYNQAAQYHDLTDHELLYQPVDRMLSIYWLCHWEAKYLGLYAHSGFCVALYS